MKINILTQPLYLNYGGILQNFALQEVLRKMGHEPLTINVPAKAPGYYVKWKDIIKTGINLSRRIQGIYPYAFLSPHKNAVKLHEFSKDLRAFVDKHISYVNAPAPFTSQTAEEHPADTWIVGSDQVWRPWCSPYIENCFLDFLQDKEIKRIAYAASFGTDKWEIPEEETEIIKPLAHKFDAISVREKSGVDLARKYLGVEVDWVLDPTLLLSAEDYLKVVPENLLQKRDPQLTAYILDPDKEKVSEMHKMAKANNLKLKIAGKMHTDRLESVEEWLADFAKADAIITDSFHGTVFSFIFNKPVKVLKNPLRGNTRLDSLFQALPTNFNYEGFITPDIQTLSALSQKRSHSVEFLTNPLI